MYVLWTHSIQQTTTTTITITRHYVLRTLLIQSAIKLSLQLPQSDILYKESDKSSGKA